MPDIVEILMQSGKEYIDAANECFTLSCAASERDDVFWARILYNQGCVLQEQGEKVARMALLCFESFN